MKEKELPVNENVFNALILGHSRAGDMESAEGILGMMKTAGLEPSNETYTTLLCGYGKEGNIDKINSVLEICDKNDIYLLDRDILEIVYSLAVNGHEKFVDPLLVRIRKSSGYNQDAINVILRLINNGQEDIAFKVLLTMPRGTRSDGEQSDTGNFFIRQMVKSGRPYDKIMKLCQHLEETKLNSNATLVATEMAVSSGNLELTSEFLKQMKSTGFPIRPHYFWPLICAAKKQDQILAVLKLMNEELQTANIGETLREYVIPKLKASDYDNLIALLRSNGVSAGSAISSTIYRALELGHLSEAARIASQNRVYYPPNLYRRNLVTALNKTKDLDSYIVFVRSLYDNLPRRENFAASQEADDEEDGSVEESDTAPSRDQAEILGRIVYDAVSYFKSSRAETLHNILTGLVAQGLTISSAQATRVQEKMGAELTPEISEMLERLSTGELEPIPVERPESNRTRVAEMDSVALENLIKKIEARGDNPKGLKRQLLGALIKEKKIAKLEEVIPKLQEEGFVLTSGVFALLADLYAGEDKLEKAVEIVGQIKTKEPDFVLDRIKAVKIAQLYVNQDRIDDALKFLETNKHAEITAEAVNVFNYNSTLWRLLNFLAEKGQKDNLKKIFKALVEYKYCEPSNVLLGPMIKVHLINDDLQGAIEEFEEICQKYRVTPWKNELACRLIEKEDAIKLQRITDLATDIHGEVNSLYDLVLSFVECGRIRQARRILETPGLRTKPQRIDSACERYREEGMIQPLEALVDATRDLAHIDRMKIYYNLLLTYIKDNQPEKALGLWTKLQEESIAPSDQFLIKLADFLKENNLNVPFIVPEQPKFSTKVESIETVVPKSEVSHPTKTTTKVTATKPGPINISLNLQAYKDAIKQNDVDAATAAKKNLSAADKATYIDHSNFLEILIKNERLNEAKKLVDEIFQSGHFPINRVFRFFLNRISSAGDLTTLKELSTKLDAEQKRNLSFDNRFCNAAIVADKIDEYFEKLESEIVNAKDEVAVKEAAEQFPRGGAFGILEKRPEYIERFHSLAEKYAEKNVLGPMNVVWAHYFIQGNNEVAEQIWTKYLQNEPRIMFQQVCKAAKDKQDLTLARKLVNKLKEAKISETALGIAYSCLLDVLVLKENFDESLKVVEEAHKHAGLDTINRTALQRVKTGVEKLGTPFVFTIPPKQKHRPDDTTSSSSGSSSDDEVEKQLRQ